MFETFFLSFNHNLDAFLCLHHEGRDIMLFKTTMIKMLECSEKIDQIGDCLM